MIGSLLRSWWFRGAVIVLVVVLVGGWLVLRGDSRVRHEPLSGEWSSDGIPGTVTEQAWEWSDEEAVGFPTLSPLPSGVLVRLEDGVVALDGASGEERWSYRVEGTRVWTDVSASGERVHVLFPDEPQDRSENGAASEGSEGVAGRRVVLDGATGEVIGDHEEMLLDDVSELGVFDVDAATDAGLLSLPPEPRLDALLRSDVDGEELWLTEDLFSCGDSKVERTERPVVFPETVVVRAVCGSGETELTALNLDDGSVLWSMTGADEEFLVSDGGLRRIGGLLAVDEAGSVYEPEGGTRYAETVVIDPVSGEVVGEGVEERGDRFLVRTLETGYLLSGRTDEERVYNYELRGFDGETVAATGEYAVSTQAVSAYLLPLEESLLKLEPGRGTGDLLTVAPWAGETEPEQVALPRRLDTSLASQDREVTMNLLGEDRFLAVPGSVVMVERPEEDRGGATVLGFR